MNRQHFEHFLQFPGELSSAQQADLVELVRSFPYCQTLYLMLAKAHSTDDSVYFEHHLHLAAAFAADRKRLRQLILECTDLSSSDDSHNELTEHAPGLTDAEPVDFDHFRQLISELEKTIGDLKTQRGKSRMYDIEKEFKEMESGPALTPFADSTPTWEEPADRQEGVILQPSKSPFFDPVDIARKSVLEHDDLATETLAQVYAAQGYFQRAIKIYQQLILKFPEKSRYFAAQNLENNPDFKH